MNQCGSSCRLVEYGASAALPSIQKIMTVVLRRKLNVKLLPLISVKWSANYIQKLENPATVLICHFLLSVWPMKIKEDIHLQQPLPSPSSSSSSSLQTSLSESESESGKLFDEYSAAALCHCVTVEAENGQFTPGMSQQRSEKNFFKSVWIKKKSCACDSSSINPSLLQTTPVCYYNV